LIAAGGLDWLRSAAREAGIKRYVVKDNNADDKKAYISFMAGKN
jgi:hypothetical protein